MEKTVKGNKKLLKVKLIIIISIIIIVDVFIPVFQATDFYLFIYLFFGSTIIIVIIIIIIIIEVSLLVFQISYICLANWQVN